MKKIFISLLSVLLLQTVCFAKDILQFDFPNDGWHKVSSPDSVASKKCYVPYNQSAESYTEMLVFQEKVIKTLDLSALAILDKQLGKDRNNYLDIYPEYVKRDFDDSMVTFCSKIRNTCVVERAFKGNNGIVLVSYINKAPHYSQNIFGQWTNILSKIKVYEPKSGEKTPNNLIELD